MATSVTLCSLHPGSGLSSTNMPPEVRQKKHCKPKYFRDLSTVQSKELYLAEEKVVLNQNIPWPLKVSDQSPISNNNGKKKKQLKKVLFFKVSLCRFCKYHFCKKMNLKQWNNGQVSRGIMFNKTRKKELEEVIYHLYVYQAW